MEADIFDEASHCGYIAGRVEKWDNLVNCTQPLKGRFAQLQLLLTDSFYLQLYEVEVHGYW